MNKIEVISKSKIINEIDDRVTLSSTDDLLTIKVSGEIKEMILLINNIYENVTVVANDNAIVTLFEIKDNKSFSSFNYKYVLGNESKMIINKFYYMGEYNEIIDVNLDGMGSDILFNLSAMTLDNQKYTITLNHNNKKTISNVYNHGVTFGDGTLELIVNGVVKSGMSDSVLNQDNKIMTMGNGKNIIKPNLYVDENMVEARHGASIGRFNDEEIFYLETRGVPAEVGYHLLLNGFLLGNLQLEDDMKKELSNIIEKFGR